MQYSNQLFSLSEEEKTILHIISENPANIYQLSKKTEMYPSMRLGRWAIKNKLYGTKMSLGLIKTNYILEKNGKQQPNKKQEKIFFLAIKGIIAVLDTGTPIEKIWGINSYLKFLFQFIKNKQIQKIIKNYFLNQIKFFCMWHIVQKNQLTMIPHFHRYYKNFFQSIWYDKLDVIPINQIQINEKKILEKVVCDYVSIDILLSKLDETRQMPSIT
ncbi:MAG: hypothetical protein KC444_06905, partial [Nitrosopumilus sp.]|nr:hypothetical protein [Nitrosopumilus sp.]